MEEKRAETESDARIRAFLAELSKLDEQRAIAQRADLRRQLYAAEEHARGARQVRDDAYLDAVSARVIEMRTMLGLAERAVQAHAEVRDRAERERAALTSRAYLRVVAAAERTPAKRKRGAK